MNKWYGPGEITESDIARFWRKVDKTEDCWNWTATKSNGYGNFTYNGMDIRAHRFSVLLKQEIPPKMVLDHMCRNRSCVNPDHLRIVTNRQNSIENSNSVSAINLKKTHCKRGHMLAGENLVKSALKKFGVRYCIACSKIHKEKSSKKKKDARVAVVNLIETLRVENVRIMEALRQIANCCNCTELCTCSEWAISKAKEALAQSPKSQAALEVNCAKDAVVLAAKNLLFVCVDLDANEDLPIELCELTTKLAKSYSTFEDASIEAKRKDDLE